MACASDRKALSVDEIVKLVIDKDTSGKAASEINAGFDVDSKALVRRKCRAFGGLRRNYFRVSLQDADYTVLHAA